MRTDKTFDITAKARIYHTMAQLTASFSSVMRYCEDLEQAGVLTQKYRRLYQAFTMEIQAQLNSDILEHMDSVENGGLEPLRPGPREMGEISPV